MRERLVYFGYTYIVLGCRSRQAYIIVFQMFSTLAPFSLALGGGCQSRRGYSHLLWHPRLLRHPPHRSRHLLWRRRLCGRYNLACQRAGEEVRLYPPRVPGITAGVLILSIKTSLSWLRAVCIKADLILSKTELILSCFTRLPLRTDF